MSGAPIASMDLALRRSGARPPLEVLARDVGTRADVVAAGGECARAPGMEHGAREAHAAGLPPSYRSDGAATARTAHSALSCCVCSLLDGSNVLDPLSERSVRAGFSG